MTLDVADSANLAGYGRDAVRYADVSILLPKQENMASY
jgi:hypothetical protein